VTAAGSPAERVPYNRGSIDALPGCHGRWGTSMAPRTQPQTTLKRSPGYALAIYAAICFGVAGYYYSAITTLESSAGSTKIPVLLMLPYEVAGKWGLVGILGALGAYALGLGVVRAFGARSSPRSAGGGVPFELEDPVWARRMREEAPAPQTGPARRRR
jgi:hypothetical protein